MLIIMKTINQTSHDNFELEEDTIITASTSGKITSKNQITIIIEGVQCYCVIIAPKATVILDGRKKRTFIYGDIIAHKVEIKGDVSIYHNIFEDGKLKIKDIHGALELEQDRKLTGDIRQDIISDKAITIRIAKDADVRSKINVPNATVIIEGGIFKKSGILYANIIAHRIEIKGKRDIRGELYEDGQLKTDYKSGKGVFSPHEDMTISGALIGGLETDKPITLTINKKAVVRGRIHAPNATVVFNGGTFRKLIISDGVIAKKVIIKGKVVFLGAVYENGQRIS